MNQLVSSQITNHQSQVTVVDYSYDQGGRLTSSQVTDHESQVTSVGYGYNPFGHLVSILSQTPQATSEASYQYAYDGKRVSKYLNGTLYDYTYTGNNLLEAYADTAGRIAKYTYGNALISQSDASGDSYSILTDYQNSVIATLTPTPTLFAYTPFGKVRYQSNPDAQQGLGWLSRQFDSETGNNYLINRYYNADRGSFLSPDRYQYVNNATPFTFNLYQYGYANPLVNVDPEGLYTSAGQKYQLVPISGSDEMFPIHQGYYDILNKLIGRNGGTITIFDNDGKVHNIRFTKQELQNQQGAIRLFESRFLTLYGEKRGLDHVQITQGLANASAVVTAGGALAWGLGEYGLAEPMENGGKWLARRMFNRQTLLKGAREGLLSIGFNFTTSLGLNMLANHGDIDKSMSEIDRGDWL